jgi:hypothetical protein
MKARLIPLALNELLDFVRRCHSFSHEPSRLILSFNLLTAAGRFVSSKNQRSKLREAHTLQGGAASKRNFEAHGL